MRYKITWWEGTDASGIKSLAGGRYEFDVHSPKEVQKFVENAPKHYTDWQIFKMLKTVARDVTKNFV